MEQIKKLRIAHILNDSSIINESNSTQTVAVSIGAAVEIQQSNKGTSALFIESKNAGAARYNKTEEKEMEMAVLENELAGLVGSFDNSVHRLFAKYGYEFQAKGAAPDALANEAVLEASGGNPTGTWVGDFYINDAININTFVDVAADEFYDFEIDQSVENKFRNKIKQIIMESVGDLYELEDDSQEAITDCIASILADHATDLEQFDDYKIS